MDEDLEIQPEPEQKQLNQQQQKRGGPRKPRGRGTRNNNRNNRQTYQPKIEEHKNYFEFTPGKYKILLEPPLLVKKPIIYFHVQPTEVCATIDGMIRSVENYRYEKDTRCKLQFLAWFALAQKAVRVCDQFGSTRPSWLSRLNRLKVDYPAPFAAIADTFGNFETLDGDFRIHNPVDYIFRFLSAAWICHYHRDEDDPEWTVSTDRVYNTVRCITWDEDDEEISLNHPDQVNPIEFNTGFGLLVDIENTFHPFGNRREVTIDGVAQRCSFKAYPWLDDRVDDILAGRDRIAPTNDTWVAMFGEDRPSARRLEVYIKDYFNNLIPAVEENNDGVFLIDETIQATVARDVLLMIVQQCVEYAASLTNYIRINFITSTIAEHGIGARTQFSSLVDTQNGSSHVTCSFIVSDQEMPQLMIAPWRGFTTDRYYHQYTKSNTQIEGRFVERLQEFFMNTYKARGNEEV